MRGLGLEILYEDESLVVVNKPSGLVVDDVAGKTGGMLVHRLDRDTSGVMVLAKTATADENLKRQFEQRQVTKKYLALVHGEMKESQGLITAPLAKHPKNRTRVMVGGQLDRSAITYWERIQPYLGYADRVESYTLLELIPHTGRTHQLRVHLKSVGHPIVADPIYGLRKQLTADRSWCSRLFLHASYLAFTHPATGERISYEVGLPSDLRQVLIKLTGSG